MSTAVAEAAAPLRRNFTLGHKKVYLPSHVIAFVRPNPKQSPKLATFKVPLNFNKLDMRDYLWHAYNVKVLSVRSFIKAKGPLPRFAGGPSYRPLPEKMMMVELEKPFVWPKPLSGEDLKDFDHGLWKKLSDERTLQFKEASDGSKGEIPLRTEQEVQPERKALARQARALLSGQTQWENHVKLDERWSHILKDSKSR